MMYSQKFHLNYHIFIECSNSSLLISKCSKSFAKLVSLFCAQMACWHTPHQYIYLPPSLLIASYLQCLTIITFVKLTVTINIFQYDFLTLEHFCRSEYVSTRRLRALITYWCHVCCLRFRRDDLIVDGVLASTKMLQIKKIILK